MTGVLGWGLPTALISTATMQLIGAPGPFLGRLAIAVVVFLLGGIVFGAWMWSIRERRYHEWSGSRDRG